MRRGRVHRQTRSPSRERSSSSRASSSDDIDDMSDGVSTISVEDRSPPTTPRSTARDSQRSSRERDTDNLRMLPPRAHITTSEFRLPPDDFRPPSRQYLPPAPMPPSPRFLAMVRPGPSGVIERVSSCIRPNPQGNFFPERGNSNSSTGGDSQGHDRNEQDNYAPGYDLYDSDEDSDDDSEETETAPDEGDDEDDNVEHSRSVEREPEEQETEESDSTDNEDGENEDDSRDHAEREGRQIGVSLQDAIEAVQRRRAEAASRSRAIRQSQETEQQRQARLDREAIIRAQARPQHFTFQMAGFNYDPAIEYSSHQKVIIGQMSLTCQFCGAKKFKDDSAGFCCLSSKVRLECFPHPPAEFRHFFDGDSPISRDFLNNIRNYNNCLRMTSFGSTGGIVREPGWMPTFKVHGQIYHRIGGLIAHPTLQPQFLQIYFVGDPEAEVDVRCSISRDVSRNILLEFQRLMHRENRLIQLFLTALERMPSDDHHLIIRADRTPEGEHRGRFNAPTTADVGVFLVEGVQNNRDIILKRRTSEIQRITETHPSYDALQYPIILWQGIDTYHFNIKMVGPNGNLLSKKVSATNFYNYMIQVRDDSRNYILKCRTLLNQFLVDMFAKIESERLLFIRNNQNALRVENYIHLADAVQNDGNLQELGQQVILPSSFTGSPRHMQEYTQDAIAYVRLYGRPDLFITFTCNLTWMEIKQNLFEFQASSDRHDIVCRVFKRKLTKMMDLIKKENLFGTVRCFMYTIEWQKRGLPHAHILLWLMDKIRPEQIDSVICSEIPDRLRDPILHDIVTRNMVHGPCGDLNPTAVCMSEGRCKARYPRSFVNETQSNNDGYPLYRRRSPSNGGFTFERSNHVLDNRWIVPYNKLLSKTFDAHINVEYCHSVKSIKYICKYVTKGSDMAVAEMAGINRNDEVSRYQIGRYISTSEAIWRIFEFPIHERYPTVIHLQVHLENGQRVYFRNENDVRRLVQNPPQTTLMGFFDLCSRDRFARTLLYNEIPTYFTWNTGDHSFHRRERGGPPVPGWPGYISCPAIGRIYAVHPNHSECYHLRLLLTRVRGPTSFESLRTVRGELCPTYLEACRRLGLLENDNQWQLAMEEAVATTLPYQLRQLFSVIICNCSPSNPMQLWENFKRPLSEDYLRQVRQREPSLETSYDDRIFNRCLVDLEDICLNLVGKTLGQLGLPNPRRDAADPLNAELIRELSYNVDELRGNLARDLPRLNPDQSRVYETLKRAIVAKEGKIFFLDAPGGTGKTFVLNLLLSYFREKNEVILACASSGIAATLLPGGKTAHTTFRLPLKINHLEQPVCSVSLGSDKAMVLNRCCAIIWDECTMSHRKHLEAVDRLLRFVRRNDVLMGGIVVILSGDFRQTLPVVPKGTPADEINASLKRSNLWREVHSLQLRTNMRVMREVLNNPEAFSTKLLSLGDGRFPCHLAYPMIELTDDFCQIVTSEAALIESVFPNLNHNMVNIDWLSERALLAPRNDRVNVINLMIQERVSNNNSRDYLSVDTVVDREETVNFPVEFLNSLDPPGLPPHKLTLKVGVPIMVLRNLQPPFLCNGTRLVIRGLRNNVIEASIIAGPYKGRIVYIPRIPMIPSDFFIEFKRVQFPVKLAYAMTINKSQGQSLKLVGIDLTSACFSHGQLYVACSRVGSPAHMYILPTTGRRTKNIVYPQALI